MMRTRRYAVVVSVLFTLAGAALARAQVQPSDSVFKVTVSYRDSMLYQIDGSDRFVKVRLGLNCTGEYGQGRDALLWLYPGLLLAKGELIFKEHPLGGGRCEVEDIVKIDMQGCCARHGGVRGFYGGEIMCADGEFSPTCHL